MKTLKQVVEIARRVCEAIGAASGDDVEIIEHQTLRCRDGFIFHWGIAGNDAEGAGMLKAPPFYISNEEGRICWTTISRITAMTTPVEERTCEDYQFSQQFSIEDLERVNPFREDIWIPVEFCDLVTQVQQEIDMSQDVDIALTFLSELFRGSAISIRLGRMLFPELSTVEVVRRSGLRPTGGTPPYGLLSDQAYQEWRAKAVRYLEAHPEER